MRLAEDWSTFKARQVILQAINNGDIKAAQWWLERKARFEFAPNLICTGKAKQHTERLCMQGLQQNIDKYVYK